MIKVGKRPYFDGAAQELGQIPIVGTAGTAYTLAAATGAFTLSGQAANLNRGIKTSGETGAFVLSGQDVSLLKGKKLTTETGTFILTGQDIGTVRAIKMSANAGAFTLAGQDVGLTRGKNLIAEAASYSLTGVDADLVLEINNYVLSADSGSFNLTGQNADLIQRYITAPRQSMGGILLQLPDRKKKIKIKREIITKEIIKEIIKEVPDPTLLLLWEQEKILLEQERERSTMLEDALQAFLSGAL